MGPFAEWNFDKGRQEGFQEGVQEGVLKGRQEGFQIGQKMLLDKLISEGIVKADLLSLVEIPK
jgi:flagellar biosynthesis/type III secretory pathway protein FliH